MSEQTNNPNISSKPEQIYPTKWKYHKHYGSIMECVKNGILQSYKVVLNQQATYFTINKFSSPEEAFVEACKFKEKQSIITGRSKNKIRFIDKDTIEIVIDGIEGEKIVTLESTYFNVVKDLTLSLKYRKYKDSKIAYVVYAIENHRHEILTKLLYKKNVLSYIGSTFDLRVCNLVFKLEPENNQEIIEIEYTKKQIVKENRVELLKTEIDKIIESQDCVEEQPKKRIIKKLNIGISVNDSKLSLLMADNIPCQQKMPDIFKNLFKNIICNNSFAQNPFEHLVKIILQTSQFAFVDGNRNNVALDNLLYANSSIINILQKSNGELPIGVSFRKDSFIFRMKLQNIEITNGFDTKKFGRKNALRIATELKFNILNGNDFPHLETRHLQLSLKWHEMQHQCLCDGFKTYENYKIPNIDEEYKKQLYDFYAKHFNAKKQKLYEKIQEITHEIDSREL